MKQNAGAWEPKYTHTCRDCRFLGRVRDDGYQYLVFDLYICDGHKGEKTATVVARFGDSPYEYDKKSVATILLSSGDKSSPLGKAVLKAQELGMLILDVKLVKMKEVIDEPAYA